MAFVELKSAAEMKAHYKAVHERLTAPPVAPAPVRVVPIREDAPTPTADSVLQAFHELPISAKATVWEAIRSRMGKATPKKMNVQILLRAASQHFGISVDAIVSPRRAGALVRARHTVMYLAKEMTALSFPQIGRAIGDRDHTTAINGCERIRERLLAGSVKAAKDVEAVATLARSILEAINA